MTSLYVVAVIIAILAFLLIYGSAAKTRWGLSFKPVSCPRCQSLQPRIRKPAGTQEALWGGYTCAKCGTRMDKWGRVRS